MEAVRASRGSGRLALGLMHHGVVFVRVVPRRVCGCVCAVTYYAAVTYRRATRRDARLCGV